MCRQLIYMTVLVSKMVAGTQGSHKGLQATYGHPLLGTQFWINWRKIHLFSYNFMGKHTSLMPRFQCLAKSLMVAPARPPHPPTCTPTHPHPHIKLNQFCSLKTMFWGEKKERPRYVETRNKIQSQVTHSKTSISMWWFAHVCIFLLFLC